MRKTAIALLALGLSVPANANTLDASTRVSLAHVIVGEADGSRADWAAILWTLRHRQENSETLTLMQIAAYSSILKAQTVRAKHIRSLGSDEPHWGTHPRLRKGQWERALAFVDAWARGEVPDPCPNAMHWGGEMDQKPADRITVDCGPTKNEFYYTPRNRGDVALPRPTGKSGAVRVARREALDVQGN